MPQDEQVQESDSEDADPQDLYMTKGSLDSKVTSMPTIIEIMKPEDGARSYRHFQKSYFSPRVKNKPDPLQGKILT